MGRRFPRFPGLSMIFMLISRNWLHDYLDIPKSLSAKEIAALLTLHVVEVEGVKDQGALFENIVVGKVMSIKKHPNADKLKLCEVNDGKETLGMICSSDEIELGEMFPKSEEKEILDLSRITYHVSRTTKRKSSRAGIVGMLLAEFLGMDDVIFDIDNKSLSHRPDLWGHYGVARELGALLKKKLGAYSPPSVPSVKKGKLDTRNSKQGKLVNGNLKLEITVEDSLLCPRYMAVAIDGVNVGPSPAWLQARLRAVVAKPINNIVDITNYVMFDAGQPMHCFDAERLVGPKSEVRSLKSIVVRKAKAGEKLMALDEKECELTDEMLVIADEKRPIAIAGVIGGKESGVTDATKTIIFESANFDAASVRRTAQALGIRTESSSRSP